jgi:histone acetyltransferase (RNA polymerase elongator complex component)
MEIGNKELDGLKPILVVRRYEASQGVEHFISVEAHDMNWVQLRNYYIWFSLALMWWLMTGNWYEWSGDNASYTGLFGFCRLRFDSDPGGDFIPELNGCALIREVHVYGQSLGVGVDSVGSQHRGYGKLLVKTAEQISSMHGFNKAAVIAGVGTREYYKNKCGYTKGGTYMLKHLSEYDGNDMGRALGLCSVAAVITVLYKCLV